MDISVPVPLILLIVAGLLMLAAPFTPQLPRFILLFIALVLVAGLAFLVGSDTWLSWLEWFKTYPWVAVFPALVLIIGMVKSRG